MSASNDCDFNSKDNQALKDCIREIVVANLGELGYNNSESRCVYQKDISGVMGVCVPKIQTSQADRMDTGTSCDQVYTKDLFTLEESPRLGTGIMEMKNTTFNWLLKYDEVDYVIEGELSILIGNRKITAKAGELIYIPKNTEIKFSVPDFARFIYVTYPANWAEL